MDNITLLVMSSIYTFPLAAIGVYCLWAYWAFPRLQTRRGFIKISRILASGHFKDYWVKPKLERSEQEVVEKDKEGKPIVENIIIDPETEHKTNVYRMKKISEVGYYFQMGKKDDSERMQYIDSPDYVYFQGPVKRAFYDSEGNQISINKATKLSPAVNPKMLDSLIQRTWNAARAAIFQERRNLQMMVLIAAGAAIFGAIMVAVLMGQVDSLTSQVSSLTSQVSGMREALNILKASGTSLQPV